MKKHLPMPGSWPVFGTMGPTQRSVCGLKIDPKRLTTRAPLVNCIRCRKHLTQPKRKAA